MEANRQPERVHYCMGFAAKSATGAAESLGFRPPFCGVRQPLALAPGLQWHRSTATPCPDRTPAETLHLFVFSQSLTENRVALFLAMIGEFSVASVCEMIRTRP